MPEDAIRLGWMIILHVLFIRVVHNGSRDGDVLARQVLDNAQNQNFRAYVQGISSSFQAYFSILV